MQQYLDYLQIILDEGELVPNRTGVSAYTYPHLQIRHDMSKGFPLLTTKKMAWNTMKVELEFFIKGLTDKKWLQDRNCHIWDEWCNPKLIPKDCEDRKKYQCEENDLGPVYGHQWRHFNSSNEPVADQLQMIVDGLKKNPHNRQLLCSAWNPLQLNEQALPPCHVLWHVFIIKDKLHLCWFQRSIDSSAGLPFNAASYGLLLHLLAKETGYQEGVLTGFLSNCHIYENHLDGVKEQLTRKPLPLPTIETENWTSIFDWAAKDTKLINYQSHPKIEFEIAV